MTDAELVEIGRRVVEAARRFIVQGPPPPTGDRSKDYYMSAVTDGIELVLNESGALDVARAVEVDDE